MTSFKTALGEFLTGEIELAALEKALADELRARPEAASQINTQLEQLYRSSRLPHQIFAVLKRQVLAGPQPLDDASAPAKEERTRFRVSDQQPKSDGDRTVFQPSGPGSGASGPSSGASGPGSGASGQSSGGSGPSSGASGANSGAGDRTNPSQISHSRSQQTPVSRSRTSGPTSGSNWSNPSQWTGGDSDDASPTPDIGSILLGRFVLEERIGQGGMGMVFKARDLRQEEAQDRNPYVALKLLNEDFKRRPESLKALQREARKAQDLSHQNVVYVSSFDRDGGNVFMVMELLDGEALDRLVKRHAGKGLPYEKVMPIVEGLVAGLGHAHKRGIVHSDFKPSNAWVTREGIVKIFDFGIARAAKVQGGDGEKTLFDAGTLGALTPAYASVEMLSGQEPDTRDDVYALACVTYELLTGTHPFEKKQADKAQRDGMKPARVKGLSGRQFKGLLRGLAFARKDRTPTVEAFLEDIRAIQFQKSVVATVAVAVIVVAIGLAYLLPLLFAQMKVDDLAQVVRSGDTAEIVERLGDIAELDAKQKNDLFIDPEVRTNFIDFYDNRIRATLNPDKEQYDYVAAARLIDEAKTVVPLLNDLDRFQDVEDNIVNLLNTELTRAIDAGVLIPEQGPRNAVTVAQAMQIVQAGKALDLSPDLLKRARIVREQGDVELASKLVERGLETAPNDDSLANLRDELQADATARQREAQLAQAEGNLEKALPELDRPETFAVLQTAMRDLVSLDPGNATLAKAQTMLQAHVDAEVDALIAAREFERGLDLVSRYEGMLLPEAAQSMLSTITDANSVHQRRIAGLEANFRKAIDAGRLSPPGADNAETALAALIEAGISESGVAEARRNIAEAYLLQATKARDAASWQQARDLVQRGLQQRPDASLEGRLREELAAIDNNEQIARTQGESERQRLASQQRDREIASLKAGFDETLRREAFSVADADSLIGVMKSLEAKGAEVPDGRNRIVQRLVARTDALTSAGNFDAALDLSTSGLELFPGAPELQGIATRVAQRRDAAAAQSRQQEAGQSSAELARLLAKPTFGNARWEGDVLSAQQKIERLLGATNPVAIRTREQIATAYLTEAKVQRAQKRLVNAQGLLDKSQSFAPGLAGLAEERTLLEGDRVAQRAGEERAELQAKIARLEQSVRVKAAAKDAGGAVEVYSELKGLLPANAPFLVEEGPRAIADAYVALAKDATAESRWDTAEQLVAKALERVPRYRPALDVDTEIKRRRAAPVPSPTPTPPTEVAQRPVAPPQTNLPKPSTDAAVQPKPSTEVASVPPAKPPAPANDPCAQSALIGNGANERAACRDLLGEGRRGPLMVVIPAGGPLGKPLAISKFEITVADYNTYCQLSGQCQGASTREETVPVTGISIEDAEKLARWLSVETKGRYRLPTSAEWEWAANAQGSPPKGDLNCQVGNPSNPSKGAMLRAVRSGEPNGWGLYNSVGNAREWARDGTSLLALGGARTDPLNACRPSLSVSHSGEADDVTGFRLVREIGG